MNKSLEIKHLSECKTDEERALYFEETDVFSTGEFGELEESEPPRMNKYLHIRIHESTIQQLKVIARSKGMGYQTLVRMWLMERLQKENAQTA